MSRYVRTALERAAYVIDAIPLLSVDTEPLGSETSLLKLTVLVRLQRRYTQYIAMVFTNIATFMTQFQISTPQFLLGSTLLRGSWLVAALSRHSKASTGREDTNGIKKEACECDIVIAIVP